ncbi:MAG: hypothetical protein ABI743_15395, partial [bacterium]
SIDPVTIGEFVTYAIAPVHVDGVVVPVRNLLSIDISPDTRQIIDQGAGSAITFTAIGTFDAAPLTEDISTTVTWNSNPSDVMSFASNVGTGFGMGTTVITATLGAVTSADSCQVIVKPAVNLNIPGIQFGYSIDANQTTGEVYVAFQQSPMRVAVYNDQGVWQREWTVSTSDIASGGIRPVTVDETTGNVAVSAYSALVGFNTVVFDSAGTRLIGYHRDFGCSQNAFEYLDNGQLWGADFCSGPMSATRYNPATGATIGGFNNGFLAASYGMENYNNLLYVSTPGGRNSGAAFTVIDPAASSVVVTGGSTFTNASQNTDITVDRDGYIHLSWTTTVNQHVIKTYEYTAPSTVTELYQWQAGADFDTEGLGCVRSSNVIVAFHGFPWALTFMQ